MNLLPTYAAKMVGIILRHDLQLLYSEKSQKGSFFRRYIACINYQFMLLAGSINSGKCCNFYIVKNHIRALSLAGI
jgi:hypothetical protein